MLLWNLFLPLSINTLLTQRMIFLVYGLQLKDISGGGFAFKKIKSEQAINLSYCRCAGLRCHPIPKQKTLRDCRQL